tara:strand:+ start:345 stop:923 length:579 start_codon:yes stop_codon:yes gene_type:complete
VEKSLGKKKIAVFISGRGSNLKSLINHSKNKNSLYKIDLVISNNFNVKGLEIASKSKIKNYYVKYYNERNFETRVLKLLNKNKIDLICLAGFMKILSKKFIKKFSSPIINIHPSLLPKYKGLNTHIKAIKNKDKYSGATVHIVNDKLDSGKIIIQERVKILKSDNEKTLKKKILKIEHKIYSKAIIKLLTNY